MTVFIVKWKCLWRLSSLVDAACHVFDVLGFVLQAAVIVVGLHTCFDFTANGGSQLSAQSTFLEKQANQLILMMKLHFKSSFKVKCPTILFPRLISWMTVFTSKFPNSARDVVVSWTVPDEKSCQGSEIRVKLKYVQIYGQCVTDSSSYHALVVCSHFLGVIGVKHAPRCVLFLTSMTKATALAAISWAGPERWPVPLQQQNNTQYNTANAPFRRIPQTASKNERAALHGRSSPRLQPVRRWSGCLLIGRESPPWLSPSQTFLCLCSVEVTSRTHWPHLPLHLLANQQPSFTKLKCIKVKLMCYSQQLWHQW